MAGGTCGASIANCLSNNPRNFAQGCLSFWSCTEALYRLHSLTLRRYARATELLHGNLLCLRFRCLLALFPCWSPGWGSELVQLLLGAPAPPFPSKYCFRTAGTPGKSEPRIHGSRGPRMPEKVL
eukprot:1212437-Amphidinium_carterae.1